MQLRTTAIIVSARQHGETAVITRMMTSEAGLVAAYIAGGRGRTLRPVVLPGNVVEADIRSKNEGALPFARLELTASRGPWMSEPLPAAAISWMSALTASVLPERQAYPALYEALGGALEAVCVAPSARGWLPALITYERLMLRELGYGGGRGTPPPDAGPGEDMTALIGRFEKLGRAIENYLLAGTFGDVMSARNLLLGRLKRMDA